MGKHSSRLISISEAVWGKREQLHQPVSCTICWGSLQHWGENGNQDISECLIFHIKHKNFPETVRKHSRGTEFRVSFALKETVKAVKDIKWLVYILIYVLLFPKIYISGVGVWSLSWKSAFQRHNVSHINNIKPFSVSSFFFLRLQAEGCSVHRKPNLLTDPGSLIFVKAKDPLARWEMKHWPPLHIYRA